MIDPNKLDRARLHELMSIAGAPVRTPPNAEFPSEVEKTCALINKLAQYVLEEMARDLNLRELNKSNREATERVARKGQRRDEP